RRLVPEVGPLVDELEETYRAIANAWNRDQIRLLEAAMAAAESGDAAVESLIAREGPAVGEHDRALLASCDRALEQLAREVGTARGTPARAHARGRLLAAALSMSMAACGDRTGLLASGPDSSIGSGDFDAGVGGSGAGEDAFASFDDSSFGGAVPDD